MEIWFIELMFDEFFLGSNHNIFSLAGVLNSHLFPFEADLFTMDRPFDFFDLLY